MSTAAMDQFELELHRALCRLAQGGMVIVTTEARDFPTGHLILSARRVSAEAVNFMAKHGKGLISLALCPVSAGRLGLASMRRRGRQDMRQEPLVSIEARTGVSTGISAADRAHTIRTATEPLARRSAVVSPGHVFPLRLHPGGTLSRAAPAEAAADLCRMAGLSRAAVLCAVLAADGGISGFDDLAELGRAHDLPIISVEQLEAHLAAHPSPLLCEGLVRLGETTDA